MSGADSALDPTKTSPGVSESAEPPLDPSDESANESEAAEVTENLPAENGGENAEVLEWEECLRKLGQEFQEVRLSKDISLDQLHHQTLVPLYHLQALEAGDIDKLPEEIYVRGFVRRIGSALGWDGDRLTDALPPLEPMQSATPSWQQPQSSGGLSLGSAHLYLGYIVTIAIAVLGLFWLSNRSQPNQGTENPPAEVTETEPPPSNSQ